MLLGHHLYRPEPDRLVNVRLGPEQYDHSSPMAVIDPIRSSATCANY